MSTLEEDLTDVLNRHSQENVSNTPDFILAQYLLGCLSAWSIAVERRQAWYGRSQAPGALMQDEDTK